MDASVTLWQEWQKQVKQLLPAVHGHQTKTLALCVLGIVLSNSAVLQRMAESLALQGISEAKMPSIERRLARFVANERMQVTQVWKQLLSQVLPYWKGKPALFVLDCTPFGDRASIVYLGLLVHSRVLPVAWRVMPLQEEWDQGQWELVGQLLDQVTPHLEATDCTLIADRGLAGYPLVKLCRDRSWHYLLRGGLGTYLPQANGQRMELVVRLAAHRQEPRTAVVRAGPALAGRDHRDVSERGLGSGLSGSLVFDLRSTSRPGSGQAVRPTHAGRGHLSG